MRFFKDMFREKLRKGLKATHSSLTNKIKNIFTKDKPTEEIYDEIEEVLIKSDIGVRTTMHLIEKLKKSKIKTEEIYEALKNELAELLPNEAKIDNKKVILVMGVNGTGKTTSIAKLAHMYKKQNKRVLLTAGDTFRAAATEQLEIWANRVKVPIVKGEDFSDPSAVVFEGISKLLDNKTDILIVDTAGRLHTNKNLLEELKKIKRTILKRIPEENLETIIILDAVTGNNSLEQAKLFAQEIKIDSILLAKLDSSAKGGFVFSIGKELDIPVKYIGVGEKQDDLIEFSKKDFIDTLFE